MPKFKGIHPSLALAGLGLILLLVIALFIGVFSAFSSSSLILPGTASLSEEVLAHTETIEKYAEKYEIVTVSVSTFVPVIISQITRT